jgi:glycosyltransferase involved in cell wall biosynthesis
MEKCVVATPVGGMVEVIQHGVTGWLTPDFEPATIGNAITRLIADAELRTRIGKAARNFVINRFCWRTTTEKMVRAYEAIATNGAASS